MSQASQDRVNQLGDFLRLMHDRAHEQAHGPCFATFEVVESGGRYVQFCFERNWFALDLPQNTLTHEEAIHLLQADRGFIREAEHADTGVSNTEDLVEHDPVCRKYSYGEEDKAAEDTAYVLFEVWELHPEDLMTVRAASYAGKHEWEDCELFD